MKKYLDNEELNILSNSKLMQKIKAIMDDVYSFACQHHKDITLKYKKYLVEFRLDTGIIGNGTYRFGIFKTNFFTKNGLLDIHYDYKYNSLRCVSCVIDLDEMPMIYCLLDNFKNHLEYQNILQSELDKVNKQGFAEKLDILSEI